MKNLCFSCFQESINFHKTHKIVPILINFSSQKTPNSYKETLKEYEQFV